MTETTSVPDGFAVRIDGLTLVSPEGRRLLHDATLSVAAGEIVLLTGPSGCGKSTLLRMLAGLGRPGDAASGNACLPDGTRIDLAGAPEQARFGALVFQSLGLFEDLTVAENLTIVGDHSHTADAETRAASDAAANALLHGIARDRSPRQLSGGQQQRVAIARTLLADRPVLLFDEPNAGLDAAAGQALATLIAEVARELGRGVVIVAHHLDPFLPHAGQVLFMDPGRQRLESLPPDADRIKARLLAASPAPQAPTGPTRPHPPASRQMRTEASETDPTAVRRRARRHWTLRYLKTYGRALALTPAALSYMVLAAVLVGFVTTWFVIQTMPYRVVLSPLILNDVLAGMGALQYRVLIPLMTAILLASRAGAIVAADIGHRVHDSQILAMRNLDIPTRPYLLGSVTATLVAAALAFAFILFGLSALTSERVFTMILYPDSSPGRWWDNFFSQLVDDDHWIPRGTGWLLIKMTLSGLVIAAASLRAGLRPKMTGLDINDGISTAVTTALGGVLIVHAVVAMIEFRV